MHQAGACAQEINYHHQIMSVGESKGGYLFGVAGPLWCIGGDIPVERDIVVNDINQIPIDKEQHIGAGNKHSYMVKEHLHPKSVKSIHLPKPASLTTAQNKPIPQPADNKLLIPTQHRTTKTDQSSKHIYQ